MTFDVDSLPVPDDSPCIVKEPNIGSPLYVALSFVTSLVKLESLSADSTTVPSLTTVAIVSYNGSFSSSVIVASWSDGGTLVSKDTCLIHRTVSSGVLLSQPIINIAIIKIINRGKSLFIFTSSIRI